MKLYVILEKNDSGEWEPTRNGYKDSNFNQIKAFTNIDSAKRSMSGIKSYWRGEYKIASYVEEQ